MTVILISATEGIECARNPLLTIEICTNDVEDVAEICSSSNMVFTFRKEKHGYMSCILVTGVLQRWVAFIRFLLCDRKDLSDEIKSCVDSARYTTANYHIPYIHKNRISEINSILFEKIPTDIIFESTSIIVSGHPDDKNCLANSLYSCRRSAIYHIAHYQPYPSPNVLCTDDADLDNNNFGWYPFGVFIAEAPNIL